MAFLFDYRINYFSDSKNHCDLPFSVFALTQQGLEHQRINLGNQDSGTIYISKNIIIGSIADGCTSGVNLNGKSNNQTGAVIGGYLTVHLLRKLIIKRHLPINQVLPALEQELFYRFNQLVKVLNPCEFERDELIKNLLLSTILFFIIAKDEYLIAHCGDGDLIINGRHISLVSHSGNYFVNNLNQIRRMEDRNYFIQPSLHFNSLSQGKTDDVHNLLIASDGFLDNDILHHPSFRDFFLLNKITSDNGNGFQDRRAEFRRDVLGPILQMKNGRVWPQDDATFIFVNRIA